MQHILIDFENIQPQPEQLDILDDHCHIWLFLGKNQQKTISLKLCEALCRFGKNVHFVRVEKTGKNALDFYLAYYLGKITERDAQALICILSKDGGYDVLVEHLKENQLCQDIMRLSVLEEKTIPQPDTDLTISSPSPKQSEEEKSIPQADTTPELIGTYHRKVAQTLMQNTSHRPRMRHNLVSTIAHHILSEELASYDDEICCAVANQLIDKFLEKGVLSQDPQTQLLSYHFLDAPALLEKLTARVQQSRAKTLTVLHNVIRSQAAIFYYDLSPTEINQMVEYLEKNQFIRVEGDKVQHAPFAESEATKQLLHQVKELLYKHPNNKPKSTTTLLNHLKKSLQLEHTQAEKLMENMVLHHIIRLENKKIIYL